MQSAPSTFLLVNISNTQENFEITNVESVNDEQEIECSIGSGLSEAIQSMTFGNFSNDKVLFRIHWIHLIKLIISKGPYQPTGPFPKKFISNKNRSFSIEH